MRKWCRFVCTTIADPILDSYPIMPSHRLWRVWPPHFTFGNSHPVPNELINSKTVRKHRLGHTRDVKAFLSGSQQFTNLTRNVEILINSSTLHRRRTTTVIWQRPHWIPPHCGGSGSASNAILLGSPTKPRSAHQFLNSEAVQQTDRQKPRSLIAIGRISCIRCSLINTSRNKQCLLQYEVLSASEVTTLWRYLFTYLFIMNRTQGTVKIKASVNYN